MENLSEEELQNLKVGLDKIMNELENDREAVVSFSENPIQFLGKFRIKVIDYIKKSRTLLARFTIAIREMIGGFKNIVNRCLRCKMAVLLIIFSTLGKAHLLWSGILEVIDWIKDNIKKVLEYTSNEMNNLFQNIDGRIDRARPSYLALQICENIGYCPA